VLDMDHAIPYIGHRSTVRGGRLITSALMTASSRDVNPMCCTAHSSGSVVSARGSVRTWRVLFMTTAVARTSPRCAISPSAATAAARAAGRWQLVACKAASRAAGWPRPATLQPILNNHTAHELAEGVGNFRHPRI
jgi:hypothetical protein